MKNLLETRIKSGEFDACKKISKSLKDLESSYSRAKNTIHGMHEDDEMTLEESLDREFLSYSRKKRNLLELYLADEHRKLSSLRKEFYKIFRIDVWDEVILNYEFDTLLEFYDSMKKYVRINYA
jgi:hypothetical protein